ncbi:aspartyl-phosphate phosphatase Spo0E family protein [Neobacillus sp. 114]|uniref:aspartyl-phosphate phosphatase Spo0E family protein n=1 Tax=Neobacillus sp. 114 TaxID=3048535 RepID=UPI0024C2D4CE|nr:aspartyl-phosphate phosphatase Spo0E family protein [Neobacillus sp. 114]
MNNLLILIEIHRHKMLELANRYGFSSEQAVECSQKLDTLLNLLMHEEEKGKQTNKVG